MNEQRAWGVEPDKGDEESGWSHSLLSEESKVRGRNKGKRNWGKREKNKKSERHRKAQESSCHSSQYCTW